MKTIRLLIILCLLLSYSLSASYWSYYGYDEAYEMNQTETGQLFLGGGQLVYDGYLYMISGTYRLGSATDIFPNQSFYVMKSSCTTESGKLYFSVDESSLFFKMVNDQPVQLASCPANITSLVTLQDSTILAGTSSGVYKCTNDNNWQTYSNGIEANQPIKGLTKNHNDVIYAITGSNVYYLQNDSWIKQNSLPVQNSSIKSIAFKKNDQFLLLENGIYQYKTANNSWLQIDDGVNQVDKLCKLKTVNDSVIIGYGLNAKIYKLDKLNFWQDITTGISGEINSVYLAADDYLYGCSSTGLYRSSHQFSYKYQTVMNMPSLLKVKTFGQTKMNLTNYITSEEHSGYLSGNLSWSCAGNSNFNVQRTGNELLITKSNQNWFGSQQFTFVFTDTLTAQVLQNSVTLTADQPVMTIPDTLFVQKDCTTDYDITPYIKDVDSSITNLIWSNSQHFNITKNNQCVVFQPKVNNWLGSEKIIFKLANSKSYFEDTVIVKSVNNYSIHTIKPLFVGNKYFYKIAYYGVQNPSYCNSIVVKDTLVDGFRHYVFSGFAFDFTAYSAHVVNKRWLERSNNTHVISGDKSLNYLLKQGDHSEYGTVESVNSVELWNNQYTQYQTTDYVYLNPQAADWALKYTNFFGPVYYNIVVAGHGGYERCTSNLIGAIINGVHYGNTTDIENRTAINSFELKQNYPNPFNPSTTIQFSLAKPAMTELKVYNSRGEVVKTLIKGLCNAGTQQVQFDGSSLASGVYYYRLTTPEQSLSGKMMLIK